MVSCRTKAAESSDMYHPPTKDEARAHIAALVARFREQHASYKRTDYNETQVRRDFIDPFFKALGWDVDNSAGNAEAYREVIHEDRVKVGKALKAPDYSFRLEGGKRLFFVEAKKPFVKVKSEIEPAYQVRRYAWSAKLPISILTDFEEFSVYDCTKRPSATDKASVARIKYLAFEEYEKEFDFLWDSFSKEQVRKGSFDCYIKNNRGKRGTATVDDAFLESLDTWRTYLATSISLKNKHLNEEGIGYVVQQTIDRIIFLRIAEDRGVEPYGELAQAMREGGDLYHNLFALFRRADLKYNSGLFDMKKDALSEGIIIDNKVVKAIVDELYYPKSPYEFSVLSVEILGSAYEQFLGKRIRIDSAHRARIEEKPEVRKAGGVYYTPQYIVDYIVERTVGDLVKGRTPKEVRELKVLDPACGSGSFLLGAYQYLLDWHKRYYREHAPAKGRKRDEVLRPDGELTSAVKKAILTNNIHGVDLDANAVEVTKLSLLLKCMEGETAASIQHSLAFEHERVLPSLEENVLCGNSLIDWNYFDGLIDLDDRKRIRPLSWRRAFPSAFSIAKPDVQQELLIQARRVKQEAEEQRRRADELLRKQGIDGVAEPAMQYGNRDGFDAIIGNPPYFKVSGFLDEEQFRFLQKAYRAARYKAEAYAMFIERSSTLLNAGGLFSFIVPNSFLGGVHMGPLRRILIDDLRLKSLIMLKNEKVFKDAKLDSVIFVAQNATSRTGHAVIRQCTKVSMHDPPSDHERVPYAEVRASIDGGLHFKANAGVEAVFTKMEEATISLSDVASVHLGLVLESNDLLSEKRTMKSPDPILHGRDISRYGIPQPQHWFNFANDRIVGGTKNPRIYSSAPRILLQAIRNLKLKDRLVATITADPIHTDGTLHNVLPKSSATPIECLLAVLNSDLLSAYYASRFPEHRIKGKYLEALPMPAVFKVVRESAEMMQLVNFVGQAIEVNLTEQGSETPRQVSENQELRLQIKRRIEKAVCSLYNITPEEFGLIEQGEG